MAGNTKRLQTNENVAGINGQPPAPVTYVKDALSTMQQNSTKGKVIANMAGSAPTAAAPKKRVLGEKTNSALNSTLNINNAGGSNHHNNVVIKEEKFNAGVSNHHSNVVVKEEKFATGVSNHHSHVVVKEEKFNENTTTLLSKNLSGKGRVPMAPVKRQPVAIAPAPVAYGAPAHSHQPRRVLQERPVNQLELQQIHQPAVAIKKEPVVKLEQDVFPPLPRPVAIKKEPVVKLEQDVFPPLPRPVTIKKEPVVKLEQDIFPPLPRRLEKIPSAPSRNVAKRALAPSTTSVVSTSTVAFPSAPFAMKADEEMARKYEEELETKRPKREEYLEWDDLDACDMDDPLMVSEYAAQIFTYMQYLEKMTMPYADYMETQKELEWPMRGILVDWLAEVHNKFKLLPETLFLSVNLIDRFLSVRSVSLVKLQLVGVTALFIAAKYEEVMAPSIQNFIYMSDGSFGDKEILQAERYMLQALGFQLSYPSPMNFLRRISKADNYNIHSRTVAKYLMEIPLLDHNFMECPPSMISGAALCLARRMMGYNSWTANLIHYSGYIEDELFPCMYRMVHYLRRQSKSTYIFRKYATKRFMKASIFCREWVMRPNQEFPELRLRSERNDR
ncbi:G2/mitotic-specific cyclin [Mortierella claussenii]|nr:G2/mitotic-specific cyclin [Mortierella claussenii]